MEKFFINLTSTIKNHDVILIETHQNPDFDGLGSALALQQFINYLGKENYIILKKNKLSNPIKKAFKLMDDKKTKYQLINTKDSLKKENPLLIVLDTHKQTMLEEPKTIDKINDIIVLDHHIKSKDYIKKTNLNYINSNMSSTIEIITHYLKFVNFKVDEIIATFMLVGLEIDTNTFKLKTTDKTYETAAYLTKLGANNVIKQELLKESKEKYITIHKLIENSITINQNMAVCLFDDKIYETKDLALIAEELLRFEGIEVSFSIGFISKNTVGISARSLGNIDVEKIMNKLGGGGHVTEAASQFVETTIEEVFIKLKEIIGG